MIPLSILLLVGAGIAFFWAVDHGQFDDRETPALLPLLDRAPDVAREANDVPARSTSEAATTQEGERS
jgi:cbb3-type cytochrome oxidase maturation protein